MMLEGVSLRRVGFIMGGSPAEPRRKPCADKDGSLHNKACYETRDASQEMNLLNAWIFEKVVL
jgi:hypothetical protein